MRSWLSLPIASLGHDGSLRIDRGLVRPEDARAAKTASDDPDDGHAPAASKPAGLPAALVDDLTQQRTAIVQAELVSSPHVALATVVHALALRTFYRFSAVSSCLAITISPPSTKVARDSKASDALQ
jgi:ParB family chromosome partitioning protein